MNVLFVTNGFPTENHPEYCVFTKEQIESLKDLGIKGDVYFINAREKGKKAYIKAYFEIKRMIKENDYDLIHCFHGLTFLLVSFINPKINTMVSFQNPIEYEYIEIVKPLRFILEKFTYYFLKKSKAGKIFKGKIPEKYKNNENAFHLPNGVNMEFFKPIEKDKAKEKLCLEKRKKYILFVSAKDLHRKQKRYDKFKKVMNILRKEYEWSNIEELLLVNEPRKKVPYYINASELHLLTSDFEGSPNSVKECLSCNIPVVATDVGNVKELFEGISDSYYSKDKTAKDLAKFTNIVLNSKKNYNFRKSLKEKNLDMKSKANELKSIYLEYIKKH